MSIDIPSLLAPVQSDNPAGEELDYDQQFISLVTEMQGRPEQQYGDTLIQAVGPDWARVSREARALLHRSKDFRLAVMLARALARTDGVPGALAGMQLMHSMAEQYWDDGFPSLEFEGEQDPLPRSNALSELTSTVGLVSDLRDRAITSRKLGQITLGTLERIQLSRETAVEVPLKRENLGEFLRDEVREGNPDIAALPELASLVGKLQALVVERLGAELAPDFGPLCGFLGCFTLSDAPGATAQSGPSPAHGEQSEAAPLTQAGGTGPDGREGAVAMLDAVCAYLEQSEPANPAPLLIRRARNMIGKDFMSILKDIAPDGLHQVEMIAGPSARD